MKYALLQARHDEWNAVVWQEIWDLYKGGYHIMKRARDFIHQLQGEDPARYQDRLRLVAYIGYMGEIVDFFCSSLFTAELQVTPAVDAKDPSTPGAMPKVPAFWEEFAKNADRQRTPFSQIVRTAVRDALLWRRGLVHLDLPSVDERPQSRAEEKQLGADRVYAYNLALSSVVDWKCDDQGQFQWCILYEVSNERESPDQLRKGPLHTWTVWDISGEGDDGETGRARWRQFQFQETQDRNLASVEPDEDIPETDSGVTSFDRVPIIQLEIPEGLWAGHYLGPLAREHWNRRSQLVGAEGRNMTAVPYVALGKSDDGLGADALDGEAKRMLHDRFGAVAAVPGTVAYAEPLGTAYEVVDKQIDKLKDELFRIAHQMAMSVDNSAGSMKRSGTSKQQDKKDVSVVLSALATPAKDFAEELYDTAAAARNESGTVWEARGLDKFVDENRSDVVEEGASVSIICEAIPSKTFAKQYKTQFALKVAPNLDPVTQDTIRKEISDGVDNEKELSDKLLEQQKAEAEETPEDEKAHQLAMAEASAPKEGAAPNGAPPGAKDKPPTAKSKNAEGA